VLFCSRINPREFFRTLIPNVTGLVRCLNEPNELQYLRVSSVNLFFFFILCLTSISSVTLYAKFFSERVRLVQSLFKRRTKIIRDCFETKITCYRIVCNVCLGLVVNFRTFPTRHVAAVSDPD